MNIVQKYLATTVIKSISLALLLLASISGIIELLREMAEVGTGHYTMSAALIYVVTTIPQHVYEFFPMTGLIGSILGLGILASRSEIIALRAAGFSLMDITKAVLKAAVILALLVTILGEVLVPRLRLWADHYKTFKTSSGLAFATQHGMWIRDQGNFIHIDLIASPTHLYGITRYNLDQQRHLRQVSYAEKATYEQNKWQLHNIQQSLITDDGIKIEQINNLPWLINLPPDILNVAVIEPMQMDIIELYRYINYRKHIGLAKGEYALSFWQRIFQPFASAVMILIAVPFISGSLRSATMGLKLLLGIVAGFLFYILNQFFGPMSLVYQLPPFLAALLPTLIFMILGLILLKKVR